VAEESVPRQESGNSSNSNSNSGGGGGGSSSKWDLRSRLEDFAATQADRLRDKFGTTPDTDSLPVTVIPAPPRRGAALARLLEEEEEAIDPQGGGGGISRTGPPPPQPPQGDEPQPQLRPGGGGVAARRESGSFAAPSRLSIPPAGTPSGYPALAVTPGSAGPPPSSS
jgi:hypothetical protein